MKTQTAKHWDAWGTPIRSFYEMRAFFEGDKSSTEVLRNYMPCQYVYLPDIEITFDKKDPCVITVSYIRFCARDLKTFVINESNIEGFRKIWLGKKRGWVASMVGEKITLFHKGGLYPIRYRKFGV